MEEDDQAWKAAAGVHLFWRRSALQTLYATLLTRELQHPGLCVRWLPGAADVPGAAPAMVRQKLLVGTKWESGGGGQAGSGSGRTSSGVSGGGGAVRRNWLLVLDALLPSPDARPVQQGEYPTVPPDLRVDEVGGPVGDRGESCDPRP